ncbi:response regulator [Nocardia pseudobrasiliensis]|uniref:LuxR family two component transcriptional regulator n=2 Tax=Nocardia pseudobrasiliensis TaxID=45979 RepID=A0A370ICY2_9NOCA|nr:response regulator transcription factor [Nocardia pseudobrasiliensis]RDI68595.1 LuxR family two component transcriptional regulator [Nocardia pseudobrasiliensis]
MDDSNPGAASMITVVVADDQTTVRDGLTTVLSLLPDVEVVGEARDGAEAVELVRRLAPRVVLMDLRMPGIDGVAATAAVTADHPDTAVLVLTTYADDASIAGALRAGARGYLTKDAGRAEIAAAIRSVASGHTTLAADVGARLVSALGAPTPGPDVDLTDRELDVLRLMAQGRNNSEIARELFIGVSTVKSHINSLFAKLGVRDRGQAIAYAHRTGIAR